MGGGGTEIALATGTVYLALQARNEARAVREESVAVAHQASLQREAIEHRTARDRHSLASMGLVRDTVERQLGHGASHQSRDPQLGAQ
jgi:hypothetical protein